MSTPVNAGIANHFMVEFGPISGFFLSLSGLGSENAVIDHKIMGAMTDPIDQKIPGRLTWGDITLKRGITDNMDFWNWRNLVQTGQIASARTNGTITMYDQTGSPIASWTVTNAWPSKISGPDLGSEDNNIGMEEVVIVYESFERVS